MEINELILDIFQLEELIFDIFNLECKFFMQTDSYRLIEKKCNTKCLSPKERQQLNVDVQYTFTLLIKTMKKACPSLTVEDVVFCCLAESGLENTIVAHCMGDVGKQPVNQRKYRIKKKMKEAECEFLFEYIFTTFASVNV